MTKVIVKPAESGDAATVLHWLEVTPHNLADPRVLFAPHTKVIKGAIGEKDILFLPAQITVTLDGIARNPEATPMEMARTLREVIGQLVLDTARSDIQEINFFVADEEMAKFAAAHGFEEVKQRLFRYRIPQTLGAY